LNAFRLRTIYRRNKITKQKLVPGIAPLRFKSDEVQIEQLIDVKAAYADAKAAGFEIFQYD
jgi:hypothetical protein